MGARLYDPALGRFLETDPVAGGSANNYDYANQDPINLFDLDGQCRWCHFKHFIAKHRVAGILAVASTLISIVPGTGAISFTLGTFSAAAYLATNYKAAAAREFLSASVGAVLSKAGGELTADFIRGTKIFSVKRIAANFPPSAVSASLSLSAICGNSLGCGSPVQPESYADPETRTRIGGIYAQ